MTLRDFRIGWRLLVQQPLHAAVEILGLATGFAICFLLLGFVHYSFNYDATVPQRECVFVVKHRLNFIPQPQWLEYTPFALRQEALRSGLALEASAFWPQRLSAQLDGRQQEIEVTAVDPAFQSILGLDAAAGNLQQALTQPDGLALTRQMAQRLFGTTDALGLSVEIDGQPLQVRAVLPDRPGNSTVQFGALVGMGSALWPEKKRVAVLANWMGIAGRIYVKTGPGVSAQALQAVLQQAADHGPWQNVAPPELKAALGTRKLIEIGLGPLADAYFDRSVANTMGTGPRGDRRMVLGLGAVGLLILLLAVVNYVNLATVRTLQRQREIAVRRVLGASTAQLLLQFMAEAMLVSLCAAALGMLLAWLLLPLGAELLGQPLAGVLAPSTVAAGLLFGALVGAASGAYPGWLARGVRMNQALVQRGAESASGARMRRVLTALQFAAAMGLGSMALAVAWQTHYAATAAPGFDTAPLLVLELPKDMHDPASRALRDALARLPEVAGVADSRDVPGRDDRSGTHGSEIVKRADGSSVSLSVQFVGPGFFRVYGLQALAGRLFDPDIEREHGDQGGGVVLNSAAARALGASAPQQAVGLGLKEQSGAELQVLGVAPDLRWETLRQPLRPTMYRIAADSRLLTVRMRAEVAANPAARAALERAIDTSWRRYFANRAPLIQRSAIYYEQAYGGDLRLMRMLVSTTAVVFALAAFGIYVLAAHSVQRRAREIVLRKLHGAGRSAIAALVGREFLLLTGVAAAIALPPAAIAIERYLATYVEHAAIDLWPAAATLLFAALVVLLATLRHTLAAVRMAPLQVLRN